MTATHEGAVRQLAAAFPSTYNWSEVSVVAYVAGLADLPSDLVMLAVTELVRSALKMPAIAEVRRAVLGLVDDQQPDVGDAWSEVVSEIRRVGRNGAPEFTDPVTSRVVEDLGGWRGLCDSTNSASDRARFIEAHDRRARQRERRMLDAPALGGAVDRMLERVSASLALPPGEREPLRRHDQECA